VTDLSQLAKDAATYATGGGIVVSIRTNYTPELVIYDGKGGSDATKVKGLLSSLVGFRGGIVIRTRDGSTLQRFGDPAPLEHWRLAAVAVTIGLAAILITRGLRRANK
jgi:hypothetical protein